MPLQRDEALHRLAAADLGQGMTGGRSKGIAVF
jgi:hypothetical protein